MTYTELEAQIISVMHRSDLAGTVHQFVSDAVRRIERRFGMELDTTDPTIPAGVEDLLLFAGLTSGYESLNDGDNASYYNSRFELEADRQNITNPGGFLDLYPDGPYVGGGQ